MPSVLVMLLQIKTAKWKKGHDVCGILWKNTETNEETEKHRHTV